MAILHILEQIFRESTSDAMQEFLEGVHNNGISDV